MNVGEFKKKSIGSLLELYDQRESEQITNRLMEEYLQLSRVELALNYQKKIEKGLLDRLEFALEELCLGKPIDYILGKTDFFGREFIVDERVLIPRPETEELVQLMLEREVDRSIRILDIGTGSGCIPISLKLEGGFNEVEGCEYADDALANAIENARYLGADVELFRMDILKEFPDKKYDVIVSNPPYVFKEELQKLKKNVVEFEPLIALAPEGESLQFYKRILSLMPKILKKGGRLYFEIHEEMGEQVKVLMLHHGLKKVEIIEDMYGRDRMAFGIYST